MLWYIWAECSFVAPCLIRALERDDASVRFCKFMPSHLPLCCLNVPGLPYNTWGLAETQMEMMVYFYVLLWCFVCVLILYVFVHACGSVYVSRVYSGHLCTDVCVWMYLMRDKDSYCSDWGILLPSIEPQEMELTEIFVKHPHTNVPICCLCIIKETLGNTKIELQWSEYHNFFFLKKNQEALVSRTS